MTAKILLVDDDRAALFALRELLADLDAKLVLAAPHADHFHERAWRSARAGASCHRAGVLGSHEYDARLA